MCSTVSSNCLHIVYFISVSACNTFVCNVLSCAAADVFREYDLQCNKDANLEADFLVLN